MGDRPAEDAPIAEERAEPVGDAKDGSERVTIWTNADLAAFDVEAAKPSAERDPTLRDDSLLAVRREIVRTLRAGETLDTSITRQPCGAGLVSARARR